MPAPNLPNTLLKLGFALAKHHIKNVIGDEALEIAASTLTDVGGEKVQAKVDSIFASKEGQKELLKAAKAADERFREKCKDNDLRQLFAMDYGDLPSVQKAIASLPEALDDDAMRETLFTAFRNDSPKSISDEQINDGVNLYVECLESALLPVEDFGQRIIYNALKEIGKDVKDIKADVKLVLEKIQTGSQSAADSKNPSARFLVPFPHNPDFVGRDEELSSLHKMLQQKQSIVGIRPTVLVGLGGIGKTQLAVEYAHTYRDDYPSGVFWLNAINPLLFEFAKLAETLELANIDTSRDIAARRCYEYLNQHTDTLVIFDNVEEPRNLNVPFAGSLIPANLQCRTLFTTRRRDFPNQFQPFEVKTLPEVAAMRLLLKHPSRQPILEPNHPDYGLTRVICITLGYLPLALALASAFLSQYPEISLYDYRVRLLDEGAMEVIDATEVRPEDMPTRHETAVRATLKTSWDALTDEDARLVLRAAGQLREAELIPIPRLGLLTGLVIHTKTGHPAPLTQALKKLYTASLIEELTVDRLRLHPLVHTFASQLSPSTFRTELASHIATTFDDLSALQANVIQRGFDQVLDDLRIGLGLSTDDMQNNHVFSQLSNLEHVLDQEAHRLRTWNPEQEPGFFLQQLRNRSLELGCHDLMRRAEMQLSDRKLPYLRERFPVSRESNAVIRILEGHTNTVYGVAITADGHWAISASMDRTLKVWDLKTGNCVYTLEGHWEPVVGVAMTIDGRWAISASMDKTLKVWDLTKGQCVHTLKGHTGWINDVVVTVDGRFAVSASGDHTLKVWDITTGQCIRTLEGHTKPVECVAVSADGHWAVSISWGKSLKVWDLKTGQCVRTLKGHTDRVNDVAVTDDGHRVVSTSNDKTIKIWDFMNGRCIQTLEGHTGEVHGVAVTKDGRGVVSTSSDNTLKFWDLETGQALRTIVGRGYGAKRVAVTADGHLAVSAGHKTLTVWDLTKEESIQTFGGHTSEVSGVAITADRHWVVSASNDKTLKVWDFATGQCVRTMEGHARYVTSVAVTADGHWVVSASGDHTLKVWDLATGKYIRTLEGHTDIVSGVAVTTDGQFAVSASWDHTLKVWDLMNGQTIQTLKRHRLDVYKVAVTLDGNWAVSASRDSTLRVWDLTKMLTTRRVVRTLKGHIFWVYDVAVTGDGRKAVSASWDRTLKFWDLITGQCILTLVGHTDEVGSVAVTADGCWAISTSKDKTLKVWDLTTGQIVLSLAAALSFNCCAITSDGQSIVAGDGAGAVHFLEWVRH